MEIILALVNMYGYSITEATDIVLAYEKDGKIDDLDDFVNVQRNIFVAEQRYV